MSISTDIYIEGGYQLSGSVKASGAKNSVLKLMAASIMAPGPTHIGNVPMIADVKVMGDVLAGLGAKVVYGPSDIELDTSTISSLVTSPELVGQMRASIAVLGPMLGRFGQAQVAIPGGCNIGERPLNLHYAALEALGAVFNYDDIYIHAKAPDGLIGAEVRLGFASVGATENLMMAAVLARGRTVIDNAAREPEIVDLANYLNDMGAEVFGAGSHTITIDGVQALSPVPYHQTIGDRIEAGTYLVAGALLGGPVTVTGVNPDHLATSLAKLRQMGVEVTTAADSVTVSPGHRLVAADIQTLPYPGFATDLQAPFMVLACLAEGQSVIAENLFENRFQQARDLQKMGADIQTEGHFAYIQGVRQLKGATVEATDLRGGAALVLAGLVAECETQVMNTEHIDRGYEGFTAKLQALGAHILRA